MARPPSAALKPPYPAFQSHPSDLELVNSYLRPWVETGVKTGAFIHDADVYAADPNYLTRQFAPAVAQDGERAWYFYTPLRHKSVHGTRKTRTVATGGGCWHNEAKARPVYMVSNGMHQIAHRQSFSFVEKDGGVRVRTGWLMMELRLVEDGAAGQKPEEDGALGSRVLCKVYRSPRNPEPSGIEAATAPGQKAEADDDESCDDESSDATLDDDDSSNASLAAASGPKRESDEVESSDATVAAPSRHSAPNDEISGGSAVAPGRKEKREIGEVSTETSAAVRKRRKADGSSSPGTPVSTTDMHCPQCGTHLMLTLNMAESKSETGLAKDESATAAPDQGGTGESSQKYVRVRFHQFL